MFDLTGVMPQFKECIHDFGWFIQPISCDLGHRLFLGSPPYQMIRISVFDTKMPEFVWSNQKQKYTVATDQPYFTASHWK